MPLHPQAQSFVNAVAEQGRPGWEEMELSKARALFDEFEPMYGEAPALHRVEDHTTADGIPMRLYCDSPSPEPVVMYFHGGGWVLGDLESHDPLCRRIAKESGCAVISVDYGRSPENAFPGPINDCYHATQFVVDNASDLNVDASGMAVAGDSAGGHLATSVAIKSRDLSGPDIGLQVLLYPVIQPNFETESYVNFANGFGLTRNTMKWFWQQFMGQQVFSADAVPSRTTSLAGLPPAIVITAEYDVLRDEGNAYADQLASDGVPVDHRQCDGMLHAFMHFAALFDTGMEVGSEVAIKIGQRLKSGRRHS